MMKITSPRQALRHLQTLLANRPVEEFWAVALNADKQILNSACLFRGTVNSCLFHPRDVFRFALRHNACSLVVAHNHPSGRVKPSVEDLGVTRQLLLAATVLQIPVDDHLIVAGKFYFSFLEAGQMTAPPLKDLVWPDGRSLD